MIYINGTMRISRYDKLNLQIEVLTKTKNNTSGEISLVWKNDGYYASLEQAVSSACRKLMIDGVGNNDEIIMLKDVADRINATMSQVLKKIKSRGDKL